MEVSDKHLTVVYTVNDHNAFENERSRIMANFTSSEDKPFAITAISRSHEINRLSLIEDALDSNLEEYDIRDVISKIIGIVNIDEFPDLQSVVDSM